MSRSYAISAHPVAQYLAREPDLSQRRKSLPGFAAARLRRADRARESCVQFVSGGAMTVSRRGLRVASKLLRRIASHGNRRIDE